MKKTLILINLCIMASTASCAQTTNQTSVLNEHEKRITVILDTLKNDYYWQGVPSDLFGRIPLDSDYEREREEYPFRADRDNYVQELDSLLNKNLSEDFLINLLNTEHRHELGYFLRVVPEKLFDCQSDKAYAALYRFVVANPERYDIIIKLVENNQYKDEIRNYILQTTIDETFISNILYRYLYILGKETDKQILDKIIRYAEAKFHTEPSAAYFAVRAITRGYYKISDEEFENKQTRTYLYKMDELGEIGRGYKRLENNYSRAWTKNVLKWYYEMQKNRNE